MGKLLLYKCETPLHVGMGTELGLVDMPIQREQPTGFPKVESSGIKGMLRYNFAKNDAVKGFINVLFGPEEDGSKYAGSLQFTDARILFFPVKSARGIFAWITCPFVINRFNSDLKMMGIDGFELGLNGIKLKEDEAICSADSNLYIKHNSDKYILLEEFGYKVIKEDGIFDSLIGKMDLDNYIKEKLKKDIVVVNNEVFDYFVAMATEVNTRIKIGEEGVVEEGPFTEEYLPVESILYSFINSCHVEESKKKLDEFIAVDENKNNNNNQDIDNNVISQFTEYLEKVSIFQLGGNSTLGKGFVSFHVINKDDRND